MGYVIAFDSSARRALPQIGPWPSPPPEQSAFWLPDEADSGDTVIYYVGGSAQVYVAVGRTDTKRRYSTNGTWAGHWWIGTPKPRVLKPYISGDDVEAALGIRRPRNAIGLDAATGRQLVAFLRGRPLDPVDRAVEGIVTESRSRSRNPALRQAALERAKGRCEACGTDFTQVLDGRGVASLVVHHKRQLATSDQPRETRIDQLAVVCANCHMLIHEDPRKARPVADLARDLTADRRRRSRVRR
jgi:hypothetical protein